MNRYITRYFLQSKVSRGFFFPAMHVSFCVSGDDMQMAKSRARAEMKRTFPGRVFNHDSTTRVEYHDDSQV